MSELKEISIKAMASILSSKYIGDFIKDAKDDACCISNYEAVAIESEKYATALIKQLKKGGFDDQPHI